MISPIKDPASFKCFSVIAELIPPASVVSTFLFFGGNIELNLAQMNRFVVAHTNKYVIYEFWECLKESPPNLIETIKFLQQKLGKAAPFLEHLQARWPSYKNPYIRGALFYLLNSYSEDKLVSSGKLDPDRYNALTLRHLAQIPTVENFHLNFYDSEDCLEGIEKKTEKSEYILFPVGKFSYNLFDQGKTTGFETTIINHEKLRDFLKNSDKKVLLIYKFHKQLPSFYKDFPIKYLNHYGQPTRSTKDVAEAIIANFRIN